MTGITKADQLMPYSCIVHKPDSAVEWYEAYKNIGRKYTRISSTNTDIVDTINKAMNAVVDSGSVLIKNANYANGSGLIQKPTGKSVSLLGESWGLNYRPRIYCKGIEGIEAAGGLSFTLKNLHIYCNDDVDCLLDFRYVVPDLENLRLACMSQASCGLHMQPKGGPCPGPKINNVDITSPKSLAVYIGQDWVTGGLLSSYDTHINVTTTPILQVGDTSPITGYAASGVYGVHFDILHLYAPRNNPDYGLWWDSHGDIGILNCESVTANIALILLGSPLFIGRWHQGDAPAMISAYAHGCGLTIGTGEYRTWDNSINLTSPAAWTAASPSTQLLTFCHIPAGTVLAAGNTVYYLYNKWMQSGSGGNRSRTKVTLQPVSTLDVGLSAYAYDDDINVNNRIAIVIQNSTGGNVTTAANIYFMLRICG